MDKIEFKLAYLSEAEALIDKINELIESNNKLSKKIELLENPENEN